jgi:hypothetical protein
MNQGKFLLAAAACLTTLVCGCGTSNSVATAKHEASSTQASPNLVIAEFLEAIRTGEDNKAAQLLTPLARQKTTEMEMVVAPPGSDTARFEVQHLELAGDKARVTADWTDLDTDGRVHTDRIIWLLRKEAEGWRISGMATQVFADQKPIVLNFEDPADMLLKQQQAEEEIARRQQEPAAKSPLNDRPGTVR